MKAYIALQSRRDGWFYKQAKSIRDAHRQARSLRKAGARFVRVLDEYDFKELQARGSLTRAKVMEATT